MTAWWSSTTSVRKVRARSSAALRTFALGAARTSTGAAVCDIVVITTPGQQQLEADVAAANRIQQERSLPALRPNLRDLPENALVHFLNLDLVGIEGEMAGNLLHGREGRLVGPDRILQHLAAGNDAVIARIALVGAVRHTVGPFQ